MGPKAVDDGTYIHMNTSRSLTRLNYPTLRLTTVSWYLSAIGRDEAVPGKGDVLDLRLIALSVYSMRSIEIFRTLSTSFGRITVRLSFQKPSLNFKHLSRSNNKSQVSFAQSSSKSLFVGSSPIALNQFPPRRISCASGISFPVGELVTRIANFGYRSYYSRRRGHIPEGALE